MSYLHTEGPEQVIFLFFVHGVVVVVVVRGSVCHSHVAQAGLKVLM